MIKIAHVGDLHFWRIPLNPLEYLNKRFLGVGNLIVGRRMKKFAQHLLPTLAEHLGRERADLLLFSGDFSSTALKSEFAAAQKVFGPLVGRTTLGAHSVPGNHDCYLNTANCSAKFRDMLGESFRPSKAFELVEIPESITLLKIDATTDNGVGSHGRITKEHLDAWDAAISKHQGGMVMILCHFPPEDPPNVLPHDRGPQLRDWEGLQQRIKALPCKVLWLHGHHHYRWLYGSPTCDNLVYINGGAPAIRRGGAAPDLGYHVLEIENATLRALTTKVWDASTDQWSKRTTELPPPGVYIDLQKKIPRS